MRKKVLCLALAAFVSLTGCAKTPSAQVGTIPGSALQTASSQASAPDSQSAGADAKASDAAPAGSSEFQGKAGKNVNWHYKDGVITFTGSGDMSDEILEADPNYGADNRDMMEKMTRIVIEKGITSISDFAFAYCPNVTDVAIPDSVASIGLGAFVGCENLKSITIPDSVKSIGGGAFVFCNFDEATTAKIEAISPIAFDSSVFNQ